MKVKSHSPKVAPNQHQSIQTIMVNAMIDQRTQDLDMVRTMSRKSFNHENAIDLVLNSFDVDPVMEATLRVDLRMNATSMLQVIVINARKGNDDVMLEAVRKLRNRAEDCFVKRAAKYEIDDEEWDDISQDIDDYINMATGRAW